MVVEGIFIPVRSVELVKMICGVGRQFENIGQSIRSCRRMGGFIHCIERFWM
jgi:hypothetical protein